MKEDRDKLKEYFETGDRPSEAQFIKFIDSMIIQKDDDVWVTGADKKVGIGEEFPAEKLHVDGSIRLHGDISGQHPWRTFTIGSAPNGMGPYMHLHPKNVANEGGKMAFVAGEGDSGGFRFLQFEKDASNTNRWHPRLQIEKGGNVGVGTESPLEKLHVDGSIRLHGDISGQHSWRTFTIGSSPNLAGPYMHLHPKNVANEGGLMAFVAGEGDSGGFKFLQYENDANNIKHWYPRLKIEKDGNVGIGTESPLEKLHVDGSIRLHGDISGQHSWRTFTIGSAPNLAGPYMHFHPKGVANSGGEMTLVAGDGPKGGFRFLQYEKDSGGTKHWYPRLAIQQDGKVGVGTENPRNKLEIDNTGGSDTGLCLPNGATGGSVLICDDITGNTSWQRPSYLDDGDWGFHSNGNDIFSAKSGKVGIGTNSPDEKLHISGHLKISNGNIRGDQSNGLFTIGNHGPYLQLQGNGGGGSFDMISGEGNTGGFGFYQKHTNGVQVSWKLGMRIEKDGTIGVQKNNIHLKAYNDANHGIGWFGTGKEFASEAIDGPVMYGHSGGALGTNHYGANKVALRWDKDGRMNFRNDVNFKKDKNLRVDGLPLCGKTTFQIVPNSGADPSFLAQEYGPNDVGQWETFHDPRYYEAFITSFQWDHAPNGFAGGQKKTFSVSVNANATDTKWVVQAWLPNNDNNNTTRWVKVLFIRKEAF